LGVWQALLLTPAPASAEIVIPANAVLVFTRGGGDP